jgi:hypothetical protein
MDERAGIHKIHSILTHDRLIWATCSFHVMKDCSSFGLGALTNYYNGFQAVLITLLRLSSAVHKDMAIMRNGSKNYDDKTSFAPKSEALLGISDEVRERDCLTIILSPRVCLSSVPRLD